MRRFVVLSDKVDVNRQRHVDLYDRHQQRHLYLSGPVNQFTRKFDGPVTLNAGGVTEPVVLVPADDSDFDPQDITGNRLRNDLLRGLLISVIQDSQG